MPSAVDWFNMRRKADKGFLQYPRMYAGLVGGGVSRSDLDGICKGASLRWAESYCLHGSDVEFWKQYEGNMSNLKDIVEAQRSPKSARRIKYVRTNDKCIQSGSKIEDLWLGGGQYGLKGYTIVPKGGVMHSVVSAGDANCRGSLFDPNIGQFNIPSSHFPSMYSLWSALWSFYNIERVLVFDIHASPALETGFNEEWDIADFDPMEEWEVINNVSPRSSSGFDFVD